MQFVLSLRHTPNYFYLAFKWLFDLQIIIAEVENSADINKTFLKTSFAHKFFLRHRIFVTRLVITQI